MIDRRDYTYNKPKPTIHEIRRLIKYPPPHTSLETSLVQEIITNLSQHILHEDDDIIVVNKPAGIPTHASGNYPIGMEEIIRFMRSDPENMKKDVDIAAIHRLDAPTSGVVAYAKSQHAFDVLFEAFRAKTQQNIEEERAPQKTYLALVDGAYFADQNTKIILAIAPQSTNPSIMEVIPWNQRFKVPNTKVAVTFFSPIAILRGANGKERTLVEVKPDTGRTHQIRVSLREEGHPIVGDLIYNGNFSSSDSRLMLHAWRLSFPHPTTGEILNFEAPIPEAILAAMRSMEFAYALGKPTEGRRRA